jgi:hypothetical protein
VFVTLCICYSDFLPVGDVLVVRPGQHYRLEDHSGDSGCDPCCYDVTA